MNQISNMIYRFIVYHPYISMGIAAAIGILIYIKPKEILKTAFILLVLAALGYVLYMILGATESGFLQKDKLIHKSL